MALTRGFDSLTHLLTGSATVAAIVISQSVAVYAKTGQEVYKIAVPVTVQINSAISINTFIALKPQIRQVNTTVTVNNTASSRVANLNNPNTADDYFNRGVVRHDSGDYQGAISDFNKALKIDPNHAYAYAGRGATLYMVGDKRKAREEWETAAQLFRQQGNEDGYKAMINNLRNLK